MTDDHGEDGPGASGTLETREGPSRSLVQVLRIADETITVADLVAGQQVFTVRPGWPARTAHAELTRRGYSQAPITDVPIGRVVTIADLDTDAATVGEVSRPVPEEMIIDEASPLSLALERLVDQPVLLVSHRGHTTGVVTVADLEHPAVSLVILAMITAGEAALDELIEHASGGGWLPLLNDADRQAVQAVYDDRRRHDAEFSLVRCLDLPKRVDLVSRLELAGPLGFDSNRALERWKKTVVRVRNHLAHGSTVLSAVPRPADALAAIAEIRSFADRSWQLVADQPAAAGGAAARTDELGPGES